jgi:hypothetical protein
MSRFCMVGGGIPFGRSRSIDQVLKTDGFGTVSKRESEVRALAIHKKQAGLRLDIC